MGTAVVDGPTIEQSMSLDLILMVLYSEVIMYIYMYTHIHTLCTHTYPYIIIYLQYIHTQHMFIHTYIKQRTYVTYDN